MECPADHIELLGFRQLDEVHGVPAHADGEMGVLLRMLYRVFQGIFTKHVYVRV